MYDGNWFASLSAILLKLFFWSVDVLLPLPPSTTCVNIRQIMVECHRDFNTITQVYMNIP